MRTAATTSTRLACSTLRQHERLASQLTHSDEERSSRSTDLGHLTGACVPLCGVHAGVFHPGPGLEAYLLPSSRLARRLLLTARLAAPPSRVHLLAGDLGEGEMLLAVIHRCAVAGGLRGGACILCVRPVGSACVEHAGTG
jgi:hypothetical protein